MAPARPAANPLTLLIAFCGTAAGVLALFSAQSALAPLLIGGPGSVCPTPECAIGAGVWLIFGGFAALCASVIAGVVLALRNRGGPLRDAVRRGLLVVLWCVLAYLAESIVLWILV